MIAALSCLAVMSESAQGRNSQTSGTAFGLCDATTACARILHCGVDPRWYAIYTRSRHEKSAADLLRRKRIETFLPLYETIRRWKNGDHHVALPLFPGYAFVHIALRDRLQVLKVPGVVRLVGFDGNPIELPDEEIEGLRRALASGVRAVPHPYLAVGRRVRVTAGPLAGRQGILVRRKGASRVVLSIDLIQRSIVVDVDANSLDPVS